MLQYKRNINAWLFILRFLLIAGIGAVMFFIIIDQTIPAIIIAIALLLAAFIRIRGIQVYADHFVLQEYCWFALRGREWVIDKSHKSRIESFSNSDEVGSMPESTPEGTWLDILFLPVLFVALIKSGKRGITIKELPDEGRMRNVRITLSNREYHFIDNTGILQ